MRKNIFLIIAWALRGGKYINC